jgi:hypothetical protein
MVEELYGRAYSDGELEVEDHDLSEERGYDGWESRGWTEEGSDAKGKVLVGEKGGEKDVRELERIYSGEEDGHVRTCDGPRY